MRFRTVVKVPSSGSAPSEISALTPYHQLAVLHGAQKIGLLGMGFLYMLEKFRRTTKRAQTGVETAPVFTSGMETLRFPFTVGLHKLEKTFYCGLLTIANVVVVVIFFILPRPGAPCSARLIRRIARFSASFVASPSTRASHCAGVADRSTTVSPGPRKGTRIDSFNQPRPYLTTRTRCRSKW